MLCLCVDGPLKVEQLSQTLVDLHLCQSLLVNEDLRVGGGRDSVHHGVNASQTLLGELAQVTSLEEDFGPPMDEGGFLPEIQFLESLTVDNTKYFETGFLEAEILDEKLRVGFKLLDSLDLGYHFGHILLLDWLYHFCV